MINKKEDILGFMGIAMFVVLAFFFISSLSQQPFNHTSGSFKYNVVTEFHTIQAKATLVDGIQMATIQKSCLNLLFNSNINLFNKTYKVLADNCKISHHIVLLQKNQLSIKPKIQIRFCFHFPLSDNEDFPVLS